MQGAVVLGSGGADRCATVPAMRAFSALLALATRLCSLVAGFLFAFALVVMPGLESLGDRPFVRAFQVVDRVIALAHRL